MTAFCISMHWHRSETNTERSADHFAVICHTDKRPCCGTLPNRFGKWYYPNGSIVPVEGAKNNFYRDRGDEGVVRLNRRNYSMYPTGRYHCEIPDANNTNHILYVDLRSPGPYGALLCMPSFCVSMQSLELSCRKCIYNQPWISVNDSFVLTCNTIHWGTNCAADTYFIFCGDELLSNANTFPFSLSDVGNHFTCKWCQLHKQSNLTSTLFNACS